MTALHYEIIISRKHELVSVPGVTIHELSRLCECHLSVAKRLFSIGLIEPLSAGDTPLFDRSAVVRARKALRLKRDLGLTETGSSPVPGRLKPIFASRLSPGPFTMHPITATTMPSKPL